MENDQAHDDRTMRHVIKMDANGQFCLPTGLRQRLGVAAGRVLLLDETSDGVVLRTTGQAVAAAQRLARQHTGDHPAATVDAFLAGRRTDSGD